MLAYLYCLETVTLIERQQQRLQICENNWVRRIAEVKRVDIRRMEELREDIGVHMNLMGRLMKSRRKWAEYSVLMEKERMAERG